MKFQETKHVKTLANKFIIILDLLIVNLLKQQGAVVYVEAPMVVKK